MRTIKGLAILLLLIVYSSCVYGQAGAILRYGAKKAIRAEVKQAIKNEVKSAVRNDLKYAVRNDIRSAAKRDLTLSLRTSIKETVRNDMIKRRWIVSAKEVMADIRSEVQSDIHGRIYSETVNQYYRGRLAEDLRRGFSYLDGTSSGYIGLPNETAQIQSISDDNKTLPISELRSLAEDYEKGNGVEVDLGRAFYYYLKAAEAADAYSQNKIGHMYMEGKGCTKNEFEAVRWYRKSAEQGNKFAQNNLGFCYIDGKGVEKNREEGLKWLKKSADQGYEPAQVFLMKNGK